MTSQPEFTQKELMQHLLNVAQHTATREELTGVRQELKEDIADLRNELKADISNLRDELKADISDLRNELKTDIADLRKTLDTKFNLSIIIMVGGFLSVIAIGLIKPLLA